MKKITYTQEIMDNNKRIYEKYNNEIELILNNIPKEEYGNLLLDGFGVPFQNEKGENLSYSKNFLFTYLLTKKIKEKVKNCNEILEEHPLYYIIGYETKGALLSYILYFNEEMNLTEENKKTFISNINNPFYMKKLNKEIKEVVKAAEGFNEKQTKEGYTHKDILNIELSPEEYYLFLINIIISRDISLVNEEGKYNELYTDLTLFINSMFNYKLVKNEKFYSLLIKYLSESVESLPLVYELQQESPELWEEVMELEKSEESEESEEME